MLVNPSKNADFEIQHRFSESNSPFLLENESGYQNWRKIKLEHYSQTNLQSVIKITNHASLSPKTLVEIAVQLETCNFAIFEIDAAESRFSTGDFLKIGHQLGLHRIDASPGSEANGVTLLSAVDTADKRSRYIPYTSRALNWHTDGYYNPIGSRIDAFSLYCVKQAGQGGDNFMLDHEMVYMQIRDTDPELLVALMDSEVMVVPPNVINKRVIRQAESGPVFIVDRVTGRLNMRYSARPQNIVWKTDALSRRALNRVSELLMDNEYITKLKLKGGQGIVCNNVLHGRRAFVDNPVSERSRLYYRARYYDAITFPD
ncbi:MAG: TauD/TfdA family dioxygenase [Nitrosomonadaceae bacterium]